MKTGRLEVDEIGRDEKRKRQSILVPDEEGDMAAKVAKVLVRFSKGDMTVAELAHSTLYISPKGANWLRKTKSGARDWT